MTKKKAKVVLGRCTFLSRPHAKRIKEPGMTYGYCIRWKPVVTRKKKAVKK